MGAGYFAYGSNLDPTQVKGRVGPWMSSVRAHLEGYRLIFNVKSDRWDGFTANIRRSDKSKVYGVVYFLRQEQLEAMSCYEGPAARPEQVSVTGEGGNTIPNVTVYLWDVKRPSKEPPEPYKQAIMRGLSWHGFGKDVIQKVEGCFVG